jgi:hypothetical protein
VTWPDLLVVVVGVLTAVTALPFLASWLEAEVLSPRSTIVRVARSRRLAADDAERVVAAQCDVLLADDAAVP